RLLRKHKAARAHVPPAVIERHGAKGGGSGGAAAPPAKIGVLTVGGCDLAVREGLELLADRGIAADFCRVRGFPFGDDVEAFLAEHETVFVVEQNRDAQLRS